MRVYRLTTVLTALLFASPMPAGAVKIGDSLESPPPRPRHESKPTTAPLKLPPPEVRYTARQIELVLARAWSAWSGYRRLRSQLRTGDAHEKAFAHRAALLRAQTQAVERLLDAEKRNPTKDGPQTLSDGLTGLDRATAAVEHDCDRVVLRRMQEKVLPPGQSWCLCVAPPFVRVSPQRPGSCLPASELELSLAAGEAESFQLIVVPYWEPLKGVRIEVGDFFLREGVSRLTAREIRPWLVESVATSSPLGREHLWPDPLSPLRTFDAPATASQAILVDVRARPDQPPGVYDGKLTVRPENLAALSLTLRLRVRPFALPQAPPPDIAFRARNDFLQARFVTPDPSRFAQTWQRFLGGFGLGLYRKAGPGDAAEGWTPWLGERPPMAVEQLANDPYSPAAPSTLAFRQAAWGAWALQRRDPSPRQWLVNGWITLDPAAPAVARPVVAPALRHNWIPDQSPNPPGVVFLNPQGEPEPTLRLVALRDGLEDYRYLELLARRIDEAKRRRAAGWWTCRRWSKWLNVEPELGDPSRITPELANALLHRRDAIAEAIEDVQRCLDKLPPGKK